MLISHANGEENQRAKGRLELEPKTRQEEIT
jgi:hypothetical protein